MASEWQAAVRPPRRATPVVLVVGNSLLGAGVAPEALERRLAPALDARRLVVDNTRYYDWYYAVRRLFDEGARPRLLVLVLNAAQMTSTQTRGDYAARYLIGDRDLIHASRVLSVDLNGTTSMLLAHVSAFWGARRQMRAWLLVRLAPRLASAMQRWSSQAEPVTVPDAGVLRSRLQGISRLTTSHGCELWWLIPPQQGLAPDLDALRSAARLTDVRVEDPVPALGAEYFEDGLHLNAEGAQIFTGAVLSVLLAGVKHGPAAGAFTPAVP